MGDPLPEIWHDELITLVVRFHGGRELIIYADDIESYHDATGAVSDLVTVKRNHTRTVYPLHTIEAIHEQFRLVPGHNRADSPDPT
jgi:hypothetical protein